jgi:hypothetical protein
LPTSGRSRILLSDLPLAARDQALSRAGAVREARKIPQPVNRTLETKFRLACVAHGLPAPAEQFQVHESRKWQWDFAWPWLRICVDLDGGIYTGGAHSRGARIEKDHEKRNAAAADGWTVLLFGPKAVTSASFVEVLRLAMTMRREGRFATGPARGP